jgi:regulator of sigma E protease
MHQFSHYLVQGLAIVMVFGLAVFVHEFGHLMFAILRGVGVESFAIGMGPIAMAWRWRGIEFSLRWLPVGGFVKLAGPMPGEEPELRAEPQEGEAAAAEGVGAGAKTLSESSYDDLMALANKGLLTKVLVFGGGVFMNFVAAMTAMTIGLMLPQQAPDVPLDVWKVEKHSPAELAGVRSDDRVVAVNGVAVNYRFQMDKTIDELMAKAGLAGAGSDKISSFPLTLTLTRGQGASRATLTAAPLALARVMNDIEFSMPPLVGDVNVGTPSDKAGLRRGDRVVAIAGRPVKDFTQIHDLLLDKVDKPVAFELSRAGQRLVVTIQPILSPLTFNGGFIGIGPGAEKNVRVPGMSFVEAVTTAPGATVEMLVKLVQGNVNFFRKASLKQVGENLGGPVLIARFTARAASYGLVEVINFFIVLNLLLMFMNMLPLPVLDGGFIAIAFIEAIIRRPVPARLLGPIYSAFVIFFISFMALITLMDIKHWLF